jgi:uncharacterized membrane protein YtjA (UPF0391 family)
MLYYTLIFLLVALLAGALGFGGIAGTAATIARVLFVIFLVLFLVSLIKDQAQEVRGKRLRRSLLSDAIKILLATDEELAL